MMNGGCGMEVKNKFIARKNLKNMQFVDTTHIVE